MSAPSKVNLVSAFGRGETLALALLDKGFEVNVLDFTMAFPAEYHHGLGPFPVAMISYLPAQEAFLRNLRTLPRGVSFWLPAGPLETHGPMASFFEQNSQAMKNWRAGKPVADFASDWMRRFFKQWASPYMSDSWVEHDETSLPAEAAFATAVWAGDFSLLRAGGHQVVRCQALLDVQTEKSRIVDIEVESGRGAALQADQWVWCLSSQETEIVGPSIVAKVFPRGVRKSAWSWISFAVRTSKCSWTEGLPEYIVAMSDIRLPWSYTNLSVLQREGDDTYRLWLKVPSERVHDTDARRKWAAELQELYCQRLPDAKWYVDSSQWNICPHSAVFDESWRTEPVDKWRNWDLIAPETLERLDFSARLEREAESFERLIQWRHDRQKKQGALGDQALHAP